MKSNNLLMCVSVCRVAWLRSSQTVTCRRMHNGYCPQVKFATPYLLHAFAEKKDSGGLEKIGEILHRALSTNSVGVEDLFEGYTCTLLALHGIPGRDVLFMDNNSKLGRLIRRAVARAAPAVVRYFVSKEDLETLANELGYGKGFFIPMSRVQGVIDAFGWVYIDDELRLVGFQVTRSPTHPISGSQLVQVNELARIIKSAPIKPAHVCAALSCVAGMLSGGVDDRCLCTPVPFVRLAAVGCTCARS